MVIGLTLAGTLCRMLHPLQSTQQAPPQFPNLRRPLHQYGMDCFSYYINSNHTIFGIFKRICRPDTSSLGPIAGCLAAFIIRMTTGVDLFKVLPETANSGFCTSHIYVAKAFVDGSSCYYAGSYSHDSRINGSYTSWTFM